MGISRQAKTGRHCGLMLIGAVMVAAPISAQAASPIGNVGTAKSDEGAFSYELRMGYTDDGVSSGNDGRFRLRQHIDYGFTDWYAVRIVAAQDRRDGGDFDFTGVTVENRFQVFERDRHGWDGGIRVMYGVGTSAGRADEIDVRFITNVPVGDRWEVRHNTVLEHEIGGNGVDGINLEFRNQVTRKIPGFFGAMKDGRIGVEMFNDFGNLDTNGGFDRQDHQIGPVMKANFKGGAYLQVGYRAGLSEDAPDHLLKLFVGRKF